MGSRAARPRCRARYGWWWTGHEVSARVDAITFSSLEGKWIYAERWGIEENSRRTSASGTPAAGRADGNDASGLRAMRNVSRWADGASTSLLLVYVNRRLCTVIIRSGPSKHETSINERFAKEQTKEFTNELSLRLWDLRFRIFLDSQSLSHSGP